MKQIGMICLLVLCLIGCSSTPENVVVQPKINSQLFPSQSLAPASELFALSDEQQKYIQQVIRELELQDQAAFLQISGVIKFISQRFNYIERNNNATEALQQMQGNCMSMALMTLSLAHQLNVKIRFQMIYNEPILLGIENNIALISNHVSSIVYNAPEYQHIASNLFPGVDRVEIDFLPNNRQRRGRYIDTKQMLALFYRNLAADALVANNIPQAVALSTQGLQLDEHSLPLINIMAVAHKRAGDMDTAADFYEYGISLSDDSINLISNYILLATDRGDTEKVNQLKGMLSQADGEGRFDLYIEALDAIEREDYLLAKQMLKRFIKQNSYFHQAYWKLAEVEYYLGDSYLAKRALQQALDFTLQQDKIDLYQAKLNWLNQ